ncbi:MAG: GbsR/MarR family transcriptional regulator [Steroidobacteraceae bacterium]
MSAAHASHVDRFIEQLGRLAEGEGLPRTAGRLMGLLIVSGNPLGIDEISARLKVSRASVSTNSRLLQSLAIAQLVSEPGNRRDYLQISGDSCTSLLMLGIQRMQAMRIAIREMRLAVERGRLSTTRGRLQRMERCYEAAITRVEAALAGWREQKPLEGPVVAVSVSSSSRMPQHGRPRRRKPRQAHR